MTKVTIEGSDGSELLIDYQQGVGFTVLLADKSQLDFSLDPYEWETLKAFLDLQAKIEAEQTRSGEEASS